REDVSNLVGEVEELSKIIKQCMKKEAEEKIASARGAIDTYFRKIIQNPGFQILNIRVNEDKRTGINIYTFENQDGKDPVPIFSQGDLNSIALSIFLGLAKTVRDSHPSRFILMDDPSQSLDSQQKARLVEVINELSGMKNIIVSTMDDEFKQLLKDNITKAKTVYMFSDWMPDSGPKIAEEI
ncbi:MAG: AAA family ATPase, partial [Nitrospirota bacterium]